MSPPFVAVDAGPEAVFGYGDVGADVLVVGDAPGVHGGVETGVPLSGTPALLDVLAAVGLLSGPTAEPIPSNCYLTYRHHCRLPDERRPTESEYAQCEPHLDAEIRAINPHILVSVGPSATEHVFEVYTTKRPPDTPPHATTVHGRGFLVVPSWDPREWTTGDGEELRQCLEDVLESDYRQTKGGKRR